ncbi:MAG: methyltransferase domain-containing protein [Caldisphaera sp.]|nr:methyltransferase domain-containing protein [Caldisphaera sp.]
MDKIANKQNTSNKGLEEIFWKEIVCEIENYSKKGCYEKVNNLMSLYMLKKLRIFASNLSINSHNILDAGSGPGTSTSYIKIINNNANVIAMDPSYSMLEIAKNSIKNINLINGFFESIPLKDNSMDSVIAMFSFRDARNYEIALKEFSRILKSDGKLIILDLYRPENILEKIISFLQFNILSVISGFLMGCGKDSLRYPDLHRTLNNMYTSKEFEFVAKKYFKKVIFKRMPIIVGILYARNPIKNL